MCGRYVTPSYDGLTDMFDLDDVAEDLPAPTFNALPLFTDDPSEARPPVPVVLESAKTGPRRRLVPAEWNFAATSAPARFRTPPAFNARAESITVAADWREAFATQRAIFPALGYYETQGSGKTRKRFYFHPDGNEVLALGGVWSWWQHNDTSPWRLTAAIITFQAPAAVATIHHRAPLVLPPELWDEWLDPTTRADRDFLSQASDRAAAAVTGLGFHDVAWLDENTPRMIEPVTPPSLFA